MGIDRQVDPGRRACLKFLCLIFVPGLGLNGPAFRLDCRSGRNTVGPAARPRRNGEGFRVVGPLSGGYRTMLAYARSASLVALAIGMISTPPQARANPLVKTLEVGQASWYGGWHNGRRTSSGEVFNDRKLTAAHPDLPLGMHVRVTSLNTGELVIVTINDRQPPHGARVIDLSRAAAAQIGMLGQRHRPGDAHPGDAGGARGRTPRRRPSDPPEEVAEAPSGAGTRGRPHTRRAVRAASAARTCCHAPSAAPARH